MKQALDPQTIRSDFPILQRQVHGMPLVYLDNAATTQKPQAVIDAITHYYQQSNANVHRGVHQLSDESTTAWEAARKTIASFFDAQPAELIMVRNTTEALNGVAYGWADRNLKPGDIIITAVMEHHANLVTWQQVAARTGAKLQLVAVDEHGRLDLDQLYQLAAQPQARLLALTAVSNALGTENPVAEIMRQLRSQRSRLRAVIDAAQAAPHQPVSFSKLGVDFLTCSGHKLLGPMGSGVLLVRQELLESGEMQPWLFGGGMIAEVTTHTTQFHADLAERFTAGTPDVASAVGLAAACTYLQQIGMEQVAAHDRELVSYALEVLAQVPEVTLVGPTSKLPGAKKLDRLGSVAFTYQGVHAHDVAQILDSQGIAVRSGHHCTMPLHQHFNWIATVRASFQVYTTKQEIDQLVAGLAKVKEVFKTW